MTKDQIRDCDHGRMKGKCEVCDLQAELDATNRQVEILSDTLVVSQRNVEAMVALARADEREACAKVCDDMVLYTGYDCAAAIRARKAK
jgi:hypothetical protein